MSVKEYKCPCCGGKLEFNSDAGKLHCPYCENDFDMAVFKEYKQVVEREQEGDSYDWETYKCPSCGGEIETDGTTIATVCPYCGSTAILKEQVEGVAKPDLIIPFKVSGEEAEEIYKNYCKGKGLLPKDFTSSQRHGQFKGIYVPFWLFSCNAEGSLNYEGTKVKKWKDQYYEYVQTDYYLIVREGKAGFKYVPVNGSSELEDEHLESIEPYNMEEAVPFDEGYLSGYEADKYDLSQKKCESRANQRIKKGFEECMKKAANIKHYDKLVPKGTQITCRNGDVKYALLPVWVLDVDYAGKNYRYIVNGQTGKIAGDLPVSSGNFMGKFFATFAGSAAVIFVLLNILRLILMRV